MAEKENCWVLFSIVITSERHCVFGLSALSLCKSLCVWCSALPRGYRWWKHNISPWVQSSAVWRWVCTSSTIYLVCLLNPDLLLYCTVRSKGWHLKKSFDVKWKKVDKFVWLTLICIKWHLYIHFIFCCIFLVGPKYSPKILLFV